jgi:hypothetical protein
MLQVPRGAESAFFCAGRKQRCISTRAGRSTANDQSTAGHFTLRMLRGFVLLVDAEGNHSA